MESPDYPFLGICSRSSVCEDCNHNSYSFVSLKKLWMSDKKSGKLPTIIFVVIAAAVSAYVFWPEANEVSSSTSSVIPPSLSSSGNEKGSSPSPNQVGDAANSSSIARNAGYDFKAPQDLDNEESELLKRVEALVDSVITFPELKSTLAPRAEKLIKNAMSRYENPYFSAVYADLLFVQKRFEEAATQYALAFNEVGQVEAFRKNYTMASYNCGIVRARNGDYLGAMKHFETCKLLTPHHEKVDTNLFMCYSQDAFFLLEEGKAQEALSSIEKGLAIDDGRFAMNYYAGVAFSSESVGNAQKAIKHFEKCKELNPDHADTRRNLYNLYKQVGDDDKASRILIK